MRQIVLDTETTGLEAKQGHYIIEIGCVEMIDRKLTGRTYHQYIKPEREVDAEAIEVHGITNEYLADKPYFKEVAQEFLDFVDGAELVIHNAPFDIGFLNVELERNKFALTMTDICTVVDSLVLARKKHPGQKNNLDALCRRYDIDNGHRELHGALLDSEILADVYLALTGGQTSLFSSGSDGDSYGGEVIKRVNTELWELPVVAASADEEAIHQGFLDVLDKKAGGESVWRSRLAPQDAHQDERA